MYCERTFSGWQGGRIFRKGLRISRLCSSNHNPLGLQLNILVLYYCDSGILSLLGIAITGNEAPLTLGMSAQLSCATDLAPVAAVEWLYGSAVIAQSLSNSAQLVFPTVNDTLHNRQYTCRTSTAYGVQERNTTITVSGIFYISAQIAV